ncbi:MAG: GFA family protein [Burkholderiales bacterium]
MNQTHTGGCVCGAARYIVRGKPSFAQVCHCTFCQRRLASAFAVLASFPEDAVEILQGQLTACEHRSDESKRWLKMYFCPKCGTTLYHTAEVRPGLKIIAAGTFDEPDWFRIERHIWVQSKRPWVTIPDGVAIFQQGFIAGQAPESKNQ